MALKKRVFLNNEANGGLAAIRIESEDTNRDYWSGSFQMTDSQNSAQLEFWIDKSNPESIENVRIQVKRLYAMARLMRDEVLAVIEDMEDK